MIYLDRFKMVLGTGLEILRILGVLKVLNELEINILRSLS